MNTFAKQQVRALLINKDYNQLVDLCEKDSKCWKEVRFRLYDLDETIRWGAIETVAGIMEKWWGEGHEEKVRNYIRTLFWSLSDESGGIGWSAPHTIAEIIARIPRLTDPYASMMIAHTIDEPPLVKGGLWGIGRLGRPIRDSVIFFQEKVLEIFRAGDKEALGLVAWAAGESGLHASLPLLVTLTGDTSVVKIYIMGKFITKSVGTWAENAILKIKEDKMPSAGP
jgi:hypothetical protein